MEYEVGLLVDCVGCIREHDRRVAVEEMGGSGARLMSIQGFMFEVAEDSSTERFKDVLKLAKDIKRYNFKGL